MKHLAIFEGVYEPNKPIDKESSSQYVNEFIRNQGKMETEPVVKPMKDVIKIYGKTKDPRFQNNLMMQGSKSKVVHFNSVEGRMMTNEEIQEKKDTYRAMLNFPKNIVIEHRTEKGKEEVRL